MSKVIVDDPWAADLEFLELDVAARRAARQAKATPAPTETWTRSATGMLLPDADAFATVSHLILP